MKTYLSHGGGVNSTALMILLEEKGIEFESIFVNHGGDYQYTYDYIKYLQENGHHITILTPNVKGCTTIEEYCLKYDIKPLRHIRWCTDRFKLKPLKEYIITPCIAHIGIDFDEIKRAYKNPLKKGIENKYLLADMKINREQCIKIIKKSGLDVPKKSGCWMCPFMPKAEIEQQQKEYPKYYERRKRIILNADIAYAKKRHIPLTKFT